MIFSCFPPSNQCEWVHLRGFVDHYNRVLGKAYGLSQCLEVERRNEKVPEVLLTASGEPSMVIERKAIVWPPNYFSDHRKEDDLFRHFKKKLQLAGNPFTDSTYVLTVKDTYLKGQHNKQIEGFGRRIADIVLCDVAAAKTSFGIKKRDPIPWWFRPLPPQRKDDAGSDSGILYEIYLDSKLSNLTDSLESTEVAKSGYAKELQRCAFAADQKFVQFTDCVKVFLVQFCGDDLDLLDEEDVKDIVRTAKLPESIDQVWVAYDNWVSELDHEIAWARVR